MEIRSIAEGIQAIGVTAVAEKQPCEVENMVVAFLAIHQVKMVACIFHEQRVCEESISHQFETGELQQRVKAREIDPHTLIHKAILENNPKVIKFLLAHGVDVDYPDENGMTPLTVAILNRYTDVIDVLLRHEANPNPTVKWNNMTLLETAFHMQDWQSVRALIRHGADVNGYFVNGQTLLAYVMNIGLSHSDKEFFEIACEMVNHGAKVAPEDLYYAIYAAIHGEDSSVLELMLQSEIDLNTPDFKTGYGLPIIKTVYMWNPQNQKHGSNVIRMLVNAGADLNNIETNNSVLFAAISSGNLEKVKFVVELGADVNKKVTLNNGKLMSPLAFALEHSHPDIVQYLLQHGAKG
ncbi:MAG: ankyrin repeat domain-containing protein [Parachlamydiales bacterium]|nr:ankyrin repeat domain-containing protein [Candidatus Acheromyda pituitae]